MLRRLYSVSDHLRADGSQQYELSPLSSRQADADPSRVRYSAHAPFAPVGCLYVGDFRTWDEETAFQLCKVLDRTTVPHEFWVVEHLLERFIEQWVCGTYRAFKLPTIETIRCSEYEVSPIENQAVVLHPHKSGHSFLRICRDRWVPVDCALHHLPIRIPHGAEHPFAVRTVPRKRACG